MGNKLFADVTELTGLPSELIAPELASLLENKGVVPEDVTMESLRLAMLDYLQQVSAEIEREELAVAVAVEEMAAQPKVQRAQ